MQRQPTSLSTIPGLVRGRDIWSGPLREEGQEGLQFTAGQAGICELVAASRDGYTAATACALAALARPDEALIWVTPYGRLCEYGRPYATGLCGLGWQPKQLLVLTPRRAAEALWCVEEAARHAGTGTILAELEGADFTVTRRLHLIAAQTGCRVILLFEPGRGGATAARDRWSIAPLPTPPELQPQRCLAPPRWRAGLLRSRHQPRHVGRVLDLEYCHETHRLSVVSPLATGTTDRARRRHGQGRRLA